MTDRAVNISPASTTRSALNQRARILGERRARPRPESRDYIHVAEHRALDTRTFNTIASQQPRTVDISGVRLIWDRLDDNYGLMVHQGEGVLDLRALNLYADRVIIRSPLRFPGTTVTIHARELIFEGAGRIDTTPRGHLASKASTPPGEHDKPTLVAADGARGEPAGDIHLHVQALHGVDPGGPCRFVAVGSDGQIGEDGDYLKYRPRLPDQPTAEQGKDLNPVKLDDLRRHIDENFVAKTWSWPGQAHEPRDMRDADGLRNEKATHVRLIARDDGVATCNVTRTYFPGRDMLGSPGCHILAPGAKIFCVDEVQKRFENTDDPGRRRPGDGRDAYPSGRSGDAGDGGSLFVHTAGLVVDASVCSLAAGRAGERSRDIPADPPGAPFPAYWYKILIVKRETFGLQSPREASIGRDDVSARPGKPAAGRAGAVGRAGGIHQRADGRWLHPNALAAVVHYARDAHANGWREDALAVLAPYQAPLADAARVEADLLPLRAAAVAMRSNLENNLDYFGNPVGWVPRLNVSTNFRLFQRERLNSAKLLYFARRMLDRWDTLARSDAFAAAQTAALEEELELAQSALEQAFVGLGPAREELDATTGDLLRLQARLRDLEAAARTEARDAIKQLELFHGFCKLVGGLAKVVPIGQPYLGIGGDVIASIGDLKWTDEAGNFSWDELGTSFEGLGKTVGGKVEGFVKAHKEKVLSDEKLSLRRQLRDTTGSIKMLDKQVAACQAELDGQWESVRAGEVERLETEIARITAEIAALPVAQPAKGEAKQQQARVTSLREELARFHTMRLEDARLPLEQQLASLEAEISAEEKQHKRALADKIAEIARQKATLKEGDERLKADSEDARERIEQSCRQLATIGDGVANLGKGLRSLLAVVDDDDPRVAAMLKRLDESDVFSAETRKGIKDVKAEIDRIGAVKAQAMLKLLTLQHTISEHSGQLASNLGALVSVCNQRQSWGRALDVDTRRYLKDIEARATRRLQAALYDFVKAYQYQYLRDVGDSFYNFGHWVRRLAELEAQGVALTDAQFQAVEDQVLRDQYWEMARELVASRQRHSASKSNTYECSLSADQRATLLERGTLTLSLIESLGKGSYEMRDARIFEIVATKLKVATRHADLSVDLCFTHAARSLIRDADGEVWCFQRSSKDPPIAWRFVYNHRSASASGSLSKDTELDAADRDETLDKLLTGEQTDFRDHWPAYFADITLSLSAGPTRAKERISSLDVLDFTVKFVRR